MLSLLFAAEATVEIVLNLRCQDQCDPLCVHVAWAVCQVLSL